MEFIEVSAKTVDDAITKACIELQAASDKLEIQVISEGSSGFFGIGSKPAVIRAAVKAAPEKEPEAPQKPEKKEAAPAPVKEAPKKEAVKKETERKPAPRQAENARRSEAREEREVVQRTDEEIAQIKATALEFLSGVFKAMELPVEIQMEYNAENGSLEVDFAGEDMGILIGKRGQTLDSLQYLHDSLACQTCSAYKPADEIVCHSVAHSLCHTDSTDSSQSHGSSGFQRFSVTDAVHRTVLHHDTYFRYLQSLINLLYSLLDQILGIEIHLIIGTSVDALP